MKSRLTDMAVRKLSFPVKGQVTYWDETTPGFGLRCSAKSKSFVIMYGDKRTLKTIGRYPSISLSEARKRAKVKLSLVMIEPDTEPSIEFEVACDLYLDECATRLRPSTVDGYRLYLKSVRLSGSLNVITRNKILKKLDYWKKNPSSQNHAFTALKVFFNWALRRELIAINPLGPLKRPHSKVSRIRVLSDDELSCLLLHSLSQQDRYSRIVSLLVFTGQRRGEIANLEWSDIDGELLMLAPGKTKNKKQHLIPLGRHSMQLLNSIESTGLHVFARPHDGTVFSSWSKAKRKLDKVLGFSDFTLHDLRRTFSTIHARIGTPIHITERLLNHQSGTISGVAAIYNRHSYIDEMCAAISVYDEFLENLIKS